MTFRTADRPAGQRSLREIMAGPIPARGIGVGDGLSSLLASKYPFDALWASGLAISASQGLPDASILSMADFVAAARSIQRSSHLPVIADCDSGFGDLHIVMHMVREYEQAGVAGVCIEDQVFPKRNSFSAGQSLEEPETFARKIRAAKHAQTTDDFFVVARTEALIAGGDVDEALDRARCYQDAGADAILIHSKARTGDEVLAFADRWFAGSGELPLIAIPTTYYGATLDQFTDAGFGMVIYANQALRASVHAMDAALAVIDRDSSTESLEGSITEVKAILDLLGTNGLAEVEAALDAQLT